MHDTNREMDTRFWGPSGWKLLHLVAFDYRFSAENAITYADFFETIPYILPCKFCRSSLTDYYRKYPYAIPEHGMIPTLNATKWMYQIHNSVNQKLRKQGLHPAANPSYTSVLQEYTRLSKSSWETQLTLLWDFLFAVAHHHPKESAHSSPMPDCPAITAIGKDQCERNKWNVLPWTHRMRWYKRFWVFLPAVLPDEIGRRWKEMETKTPMAWESRRSMMAWLWRMRCGLDTSFHDPYRSVCRHIATYSSDCGKKKGGVTCRKSRAKMRKTKRAGK